MRISPLVVAAFLVAGAVACSSSDDDTATPNPSPAPSLGTPTPTVTSGLGTVHDIRALNGNRWSDDALVLAVGDTVKVTDIDPEEQHNFVVEGVGRSPTLGEGDTFSLRFGKAGTYEFVCTFHESQGMTGTVTVR